MDTKTRVSWIIAIVIIIVVILITVGVAIWLHRIREKIKRDLGRDSNNTSPTTGNTPVEPDIADQTPLNLSEPSSPFRISQTVNGVKLCVNALNIATSPVKIDVCQSTPPTGYSTDQWIYSPGSYQLQPANALGFCLYLDTINDKLGVDFCGIEDTSLLYEWVWTTNNQWQQGTPNSIKCMAPVQSPTSVGMFLTTVPCSPTSSSNTWNILYQTNPSS